MAHAVLGAAAAHHTAILNAAWWVRYYHRPSQRDKKARAVSHLGLIVRRALAAGVGDEVVLYAVAIGLFDRRDPRFQT